MTYSISDLSSSARYRAIMNAASAILAEAEPLSTRELAERISDRLSLEGESERRFVGQKLGSWCSSHLADKQPASYRGPRARQSGETFQSRGMVYSRYEWIMAGSHVSVASERPTEPSPATPCPHCRGNPLNRLTEADEMARLDSGWTIDAAGDWVAPTGIPIAEPAWSA